EELAVREPEPSEAPDVTHLESGVAAFDSIPTASIATHEFAERRWSEAAFAIWTGGGGLAIVWIGLGAWRTRRLDRRADDAPDWMQRELRSLAPDPRRQPRLRMSLEIDAALACGTIRPAILLPEQDLHPAEANGIRAALAHEWAHIAHGDLWLLALER